jgi:hypothetical protein
MSERAEAFMDKWLDENVSIAHLKRPENVVADMLAKRCLADARKARIPVDEIAETVGDVKEAIADELRIRAAAAGGQP